MQYIAFIGIAKFLNRQASYACIYTTWNKRLSIFQSYSEIFEDSNLLQIIRNPDVSIVFEPTTSEILFCGCPNPYKLEPMLENQLSQVKSLLRALNNN